MPFSPYCEVQYIKEVKMGLIYISEVWLGGKKHAQNFDGKSVSLKCCYSTAKREQGG
jgi:hypothetical protein